MIENKQYVQEDIIREERQRTAIKVKLDEATKTEAKMINRDTGIRIDSTLMLNVKDAENLKYG